MNKVPSGQCRSGSWWEPSYIHFQFSFFLNYCIGNKIIFIYNNVLLKFTKFTFLVIKIEKKMKYKLNAFAYFIITVHKSNFFFFL